MKVSFAITCYNEQQEVDNLLSKLYRYASDVDYEYEFVFLQDGSDIGVLRTLTEWAHGDERIFHQLHDLNNDFSTHKNVLNSHCHGDYIFQIDADEYPSAVLVQLLGTVIEQNPNVDLIWVPRINTVEGITNEHLMKWGWRSQVLEGIGDLPAINWPDYQSRIYRNDPKIHWVGKVHEHVEGAMKYARLPQEPIWALYHPKTIAKQEQQNQFYMDTFR